MATKKKIAQIPKIRIVRDEPAQFTSDFSELYCNIFRKLYDIKCPKFLEDVKQALKKIRRFNYDVANWDGKHFSVDFSYWEVTDRCAYMYAYSVLNTSVVYSQFLKHLKENRITFLENFTVDTLKLCCLGGGPGVEAVAISKAIHDTIWRSCSSEYDDMFKFIDVYVTVVDICPEWQSEVSAIVNALNDTPDIFYPNRVKFHCDFVKADLLQPFDEHLRGIIKESDIVTIVKLVNSIQEKTPVNCMPQFKKMMKLVIDCMDDNRCLFMLDTAGGNVFNRTMEVISTNQSSFKTQVSMHKAYQLHSVTLRKLEGVMNFRAFAETSTLFPTPKTRVSSCIWIKTP